MGGRRDTRGQLVPQQTGYGPFGRRPAMLEDGLRRKADELAAIARRQQLVLFVGVGAGAGAVLSLWDELLHGCLLYTSPSPRDS